MTIGDTTTDNMIEMAIDHGMRLIKVFPDLTRRGKDTIFLVEDQIMVAVAMEVMEGMLVDGTMEVVEVGGMTITETESKY